jgi:uncharacterized protein (DUF433 family)
MKRYIKTDPNIMAGLPCITGTRIPVSLVLQRIKQGHSLKELHELWPHVPVKTFEAVLNELAQTVDGKYDTQILQT